MLKYFIKQYSFGVFVIPSASPYIYSSYILVTAVGQITAAVLFL